MLGFVGSFQHALDAKGRLILPVRFRPAFERGGHVSPHLDGCAALWTPSEFTRQADERLDQSRHGGGDERQQARYWAAHSADVEIDRQGRLALPTSIRDYAGLEGEILVIGAIDHVELWSPARYGTIVEPAEAAFREPR